MPSMETAVRNTSMGLACGTVFRKSTTAGGIPRLAAKSFLSCSSSALFGQPSIPQQEDDFFKGGVVGQRVDVIAAVAEDTRVSVDVTDLGLAGDDAFQTRYCCAHAAPVSLVLFYDALRARITYQPGKPGTAKSRWSGRLRCTHNASSCFCAGIHGYDHARSRRSGSWGCGLLRRRARCPGPSPS